MLAKTAKAFLLVSLSIYFLKWLFFWLYETNDSYFYYAFAEFMKSGKYFVPHPYYWTIPSTLEPPLYSIFLYLAQFFARAEIIIHLGQIAAILFSGFVVYQIIKTCIKKSIALTVTSIYLLIPANFFQSSSLMAESLAIFSVSLYLYLAFLIIAQKKEHLTKYLILFSAIIILVRYNFISLFFCLCFFWLQRKKR